MALKVIQICDVCGKEKELAQDEIRKNIAAIAKAMDVFKRPPVFFCSNKCTEKRARELLKK